MATGSDDDRTLSDLLVDQIEFANVIILNKCDLVSTSDIKVLCDVIKHLNPKARLLQAEHSVVDPKEVLNTNLFSFEDSSSAAGWYQELIGHHVPETEEFGISSMIYRSHRPFQPRRLWDAIQGGMLADICRSKGVFWVSPMQHLILEWSSAGPHFTPRVAGRWEDVKHLEGENEEGVSGKDASKPGEADREEGFGCKKEKERGNEIVLIGVNLQREEIERVLNMALMQDQEDEPDENPFDYLLQAVQGTEGGKEGLRKPVDVTMRRRGGGEEA